MYNVNCQRLIPKCPENTMKMIFRKVGNSYKGFPINCFVQMIVDIFHHFVDSPDVVLSGCFGLHTLLISCGSKVTTK